MKKQAARMESVHTNPGMIAVVTFTDGRTVRVDLSGLACRLEVFAPLEDGAEFATARIADFGWSLEWACGASLDTDRVLELALEQAGMAANVDFLAEKARQADLDAFDRILGAVPDNLPRAGDEVLE